MKGKCEAVSYAGVEDDTARKREMLKEREQPSGMVVVCAGW